MNLNSGFYDVSEPAREAFYAHEAVAKATIKAVEARKKKREKEEAERRKELEGEAAKAEEEELVIPQHLFVGSPFTMSQIVGLGDGVS